MRQKPFLRSVSVDQALPRISTNSFVCDFLNQFDSFGVFVAAHEAITRSLVLYSLKLRLMRRFGRFYCYNLPLRTCTVTVAEVRAPTTHVWFPECRFSKGATVSVDTAVSDAVDTLELKQLNSKSKISLEPK